MNSKNEKKKTQKNGGKKQTDNVGIESNSERFFNRELSWLEFNDRILFESRDTKHPLLERVKFLSITASNLDEFYIVRVASLRDMQSIQYNERDISGLTVDEQLERIDAKTRSSMALMYSTYTRSLVPSLHAHGIDILDYHQLDKKSRASADRYFMTTLYPILTPMAVDASRPFPLIYSRQLNICVLAGRRSDGENSSTEGLISEEDGDDLLFATLQVPTVVPRLFECRTSSGLAFVPIEQIIRANIHLLFTGVDIISTGFFRVMRNADLDIDEDEAEDLLKEIEEQVRMRRYGEIIRLEVNEDMDIHLLKYITDALEINRKDIFCVTGPIDLTFLMRLYSGIAKNYPALCDTPHMPQKPSMFDGTDNMFDQIRAKDRLVHLPYESFDPVAAFLDQAARDPKVLAIKQTLYRVSKASPIIESLAMAAQNGKQVMALVELKARFDEENNINWAKKLENAGCHVIYGLVGLKTHSKITLVVRQEEAGIRRYLHLGTGNYNNITAKIYTDIGVFTASEPFGVDASEFFNMLSGFSQPPEWRRFIPAPLWLKDFFIQKIHKEIKNAKEGKKAHIIAKMNALVDGKIIDALYDASSAGVRIELIVRGICCLRPGVPGLSENIKVCSITGRFLEHSRIFYFFNEGAEDIYLSSADWMPRNLDRRVELMFPVEDEACRARVMEVLDIELKDTMRSHWLCADGTYHKLDLRGKKKIDSQIELIRISEDAAKAKEREREYKVFVPAEPPEDRQ
ncbi:MAG TPA: RNA degradosome polyphosphate kinase [Clostridiaceae bacterium]|nr:RNA degradosome polyphosphate kinase [Clostridiaceae bacterium]